MKNIRLTIMFLLLFSLMVGCSAKQNKNVELSVSAAASLKDAMEEIQDTYQKEHPEIKLRFNFGGSGTLQQQISQGAPVDLFFSAAEDKFDKLVDEGNITKENGTDLLSNALVLIVPKESGITGFQDLTDDVVHKIAIGTPETVPAGMYAKEALENLDVWESVKPKVVYAKDVRQVLSYVETGNVEAGMVYKTDAFISDKVKIVATAAPETHTPIVYPVGIIKDSKHYEAAKEFYDYLKTKNALKVFEKYGFTTK